eukprot:scaffold261_cov336-Pavlova_lutheri.AAC.78
MRREVPADPSRTFGRGPARLKSVLRGRIRTRVDPPGEGGSQAIPTEAPPPHGPPVPVSGRVRMTYGRGGVRSSTCPCPWVPSPVEGGGSRACGGFGRGPGLSEGVNRRGGTGTEGTSETTVWEGGHARHHEDLSSGMAREMEGKPKDENDVEELRKAGRRVGTRVQRIQPAGMEWGCPATRIARAWSENHLEWDLDRTHARIGAPEKRWELRKAQVRLRQSHPGAKGCRVSGADR